MQLNIVLGSFPYIPDSTEITANDELRSFIRRPTCVPHTMSKILLPRIENSLLSPQQATKELSRARTVNPKADEPTGESAYLVSR